MYEEFYGLKSKPFSILPDPAFMYWGENHRIAYSMLKYGAWNQMGFTVITGEVGCGKTTLVNQLLTTIDEDVTCGIVSNTREDSGELLNWVLLAFDQPLEDTPYPLLYQQFKNFVNSEHAAGRRVVLIIDEAQNLDVRTLEELRLLFNINPSHTQLLQLVLVGQPELKVKLQAPELRQFAQRISSDFHLKALDEEYVKEYMNQRLTISGSKVFLFSDEACKLIAHHSGGIPRLINILCETSLVYSFAVSAPLVSKTMVERVINDKAEFGIFGSEAESVEEPVENPKDRLRSV